MVKYQNGIDSTFEALGDSTRRKIVVQLQESGELSITDIAKPLGISLPATLKHVRMLEDAQIVRTERRGRVRVCIYDPSALKQLAGWIASHSAFWESSFERLERHIGEAKLKDKKK